MDERKIVVVDAVGREATKALFLEKS